MKRTSRKPSELSQSLQRNLKAYALAASAAGVGMLALPAEAKIVYRPTHIYIPLHHPVGLDLNGDGIVDFKIGRYRYAFKSYTYSVSGTFLSAQAVKWRNQVAGSWAVLTSWTAINPYAFQAGKRVDSRLRFIPRYGIPMAGRYRQMGQTAWHCWGSR